AGGRRPRALQDAVRPARRGAHESRVRVRGPKRVIVRDESTIRPRRRELLTAAAAACATALPLPSAAQSADPRVEVVGTEHWAVKRAGTDSVRLFLWRKQAGSARRRTDTILFVHGSSVSATPVFDLQIPGRPDASTMVWFARRGYDTWCVDCE